MFCSITIFILDYIFTLYSLRGFFFLLYVAFFCVVFGNIVWVKLSVSTICANKRHYISIVAALVFANVLAGMSSVGKGHKWGGGRPLSPSPPVRSEWRESSQGNSIPWLVPSPGWVDPAVDEHGPRLTDKGASSWTIWKTDSVFGSHHLRVVNPPPPNTAD